MEHIMAWIGRQPMLVRIILWPAYWIMSVVAIGLFLSACVWLLATFVQELTGHKGHGDADAPSAWEDGPAPR